MARRLRQARTATGISQKQLGIQIGIDPSSASPRINQYESGKYQPDFGMAARLAERLGVPVPYLYTEDDRLADLILGFSALAPVKQRKVLKAVQDPTLW